MEQCAVKKSVFHFYVPTRRYVSAAYANISGYTAAGGFFLKCADIPTAIIQCHSERPLCRFSLLLWFILSDNDIIMWD